MKSRAERSAVLASLTTVDPETIRIAEVIDGVAVVLGQREDGENVCAFLPVLRKGASKRMRRLWWDRARADLTGQCPRCEGVFGAEDDGNELAHEPSCPVNDWRRLMSGVERRGILTLQALAQGAL